MHTVGIVFRIVEVFRGILVLEPGLGRHLTRETPFVMESSGVNIDGRIHMAANGRMQHQVRSKVPNVVPSPVSHRTAKAVTGIDELFIFREAIPTFVIQELSK